MRSPPFDDRVRESLAAIVDVNNQLAYHLAVCESDDPGISFESRVNHELPRKTGMDGAHVPSRGPDVIGGRVDRHFLANRRAFVTSEWRRRRFTRGAAAP